MTQPPTLSSSSTFASSLPSSSTESPAAPVTAPESTPSGSVLDSVPAPVLVIRDMTLDDIDAALAIEEQSSSQPWTRGIFNDEIADRATRSYRVGCIGDEVVGFCGLMVQLDEGHITNIALDPKWRGQGLGAELLLDSVRIAIAMKVRALTLEVRVSNAAARVLYQRFGFAPVGVRPKYYRVGNEDALIMWAHDADAASYQVRLAGIASSLAARKNQDSVS